MAKKKPARVKAEYEYIRMVPEAPRAGRKTKAWRVMSQRGGFLGMICWYGPWRQYAFYPFDNCVFSAGCLSDIEDFIGNAMEQRMHLLEREAAYSRGEQTAGILRFSAPPLKGESDA